MRGNQAHRQKHSIPVHLSMPIRVNDHQLPYSPSLAFNGETFVAREHSMSALAIMRKSKIHSGDMGV
jgi:hypothetical protein